MRGGILALGIILLIAGIFLYFTGNIMVSEGNRLMNEIDKYNVYGLPIADLLKIVSSDIGDAYRAGYNQVQSGQRVIMFGSIFGIIGFIVCIAGVVAPSKKEHYKTDVSTPSPPVIIRAEPKEILKPDRRCPECGRIIPDDTKMCPYCGKKFKSYFREEKDLEESREDIEVKNKDKLKKTKKPKYCSECGYKFEEEDLDFCPNCGNKL
jgi:RNA polymerase subunit RPABC4/transcription elongation factor Spt4/uncharacterized membrane protein